MKTTGQHHMDVYQVAKRILDQAEKAMLVMDGRMVVQYANPLFFALTGFTGPQVTGKFLQDLCGTEQDRDFFPGIRDSVKDGESWEGKLAFETAETGRKDFTATIVLLPSEHPRKAMYLLSVRPQKGHRAGTIDDLTGLPRVEIFLDRVDQAIRFSRREKSTVVMFLIRLDRFELVLDGLGRKCGYRVLKEIGSRLRQAFRESDTIARIERDTFGLLLKLTKETHASLVADKVHRTISRPVLADGQKVVNTASIGIAACHTAEEDADRILECAETAMHHACQTGGNDYYFFSSDLNERARQRIEMENNLRAAIETGEFLLFYQPKVDIDTNAIVGAEALIRWRRQEQGMVPPFDFIPVAEETGLIIDIGRWALNEACRQNMAWKQQGLNPVPVAVNVSPRQFQYPGFYRDVKEAVSRSGLAPELLELEITESMLMSDVEQMIGKLKQLSGVGLNLSIDDFGTGYSNLSYLVRFPVSTLKIDRAFIKDVETNPAVAGLTHSIIRMSRDLNLKIVAEGAENEEHIAFLKANDCNVVQGYYYSRPLPAREFAALLKKGKIDLRPG